jgi:hypothetical protein
VTDRIKEPIYSPWNTLQQRVKQFISVAVNNQQLDHCVMERTPHCEGPKAQGARSNRAGQAKKTQGSYRILGLQPVPIT